MFELVTKAAERTNLILLLRSNDPYRASQVIHARFRLLDMSFPPLLSKLMRNGEMQWRGCRNSPDKSFRTESVGRRGRYGVAIGPVLRGRVRWKYVGETEHRYMTVSLGQGLAKGVQTTVVLDY